MRRLSTILPGFISALKQGREEAATQSARAAAEERRRSSLGSVVGTPAICRSFAASTPIAGLQPPVFGLSPSQVLCEAS